jgi:tetratricopeptide (TPR) repeat protein
MKKVGRNAPCPCGSGKKLKRCCVNAPKLPSGGRFFYTDLDQLSNRVRDLLDEGRWAEAEEGCRQLREQYPEQIDGLHRYAELYEARGERRKAAEYYRRAANFALLAVGFAKQTVDSFRKKAEELAG